MGLGLKFKLSSLEADTLELSHGHWKLLKAMGAKIPKERWERRAGNASPPSSPYVPFPRIQEKGGQRLE